LHALDESFVTAQKEEVAHLVEQLPTDPAATLPALRDRSQGLYWCMEQCMQMEELLHDWRTLGPTQWVRVINLMGKRPGDWLIDTGVAQFTRAFLAGYCGHLPLDLNHIGDMLHSARPERMSPSEYSHHVERLVKNLEGNEEGNAAMRATLVAMVEEMAQHLDWIEFREERDRALALKKARVDASAEGTKLTSYTLRHNGARNTALRRLEVIQKLRLQQEAQDIRQQPKGSDQNPTVEPAGPCADPVKSAGNAGKGQGPDAVGPVDHKLTDEPERHCADEAGSAASAGEDQGLELFLAVNHELTDEPERHCNDEAGSAGPSLGSEGEGCGLGREDQRAAQEDYPPDSPPPTPHAGAEQVENPIPVSRGGCLGSQSEGQAPSRSAAAAVWGLRRPEAGSTPGTPGLVPGQEVIPSLFPVGGPKSGRTLKNLVGEEEVRAIEEAARQRMERLLITMEMEANGEVDPQAIAEGMARWQSAMEAARARNLSDTPRGPPPCRDG
jgi:hypothetical protein